MKHDGWVLGAGVKVPVLSVGMVLFSVDPTGGLQLLLVRRKVTVGFMDFVRGKYSCQNLQRLSALIDTMTLREKRAILEDTYDRLWTMAWGEDHVGGGYRLESESASCLLETMRRGVSLGGDLISLQDLVTQSRTAWEEPEWEFPKGRKNFQERDIECAYREVGEETGIPIRRFRVVKNITPLEETFIGSNFKTYKYRYYVANVPDTDDDLEKYQKSEIGCVRWFGSDEAFEAIRPYHGEKRQIVQNVKSTLESVQLFHAE